ncbi:hypothetical protein C5C13_11785 [Clavibacter michiganensis]|nr:hypothetical protein C5C13_11785 [Clavibacter michiganensis]
MCTKSSAALGAFLPAIKEHYGNEALEVAVQLALHAEDQVASAMRVANGEPVGLVLGHTSFAGLRFACTEGVFTPRSTTLEVISRAAMDDAFSGQAHPVVLDIGCGTGVIAIVLAKLHENATIIGVDLNVKAVELSKRNAAALVPHSNITFMLGDVRESAIAGALPSSVDLMTCNPPYIPDRITLPSTVTDFQPANALYSGPDGMEVMRACLQLGQRLLKTGGLLVVEHDTSQSGFVRSLFQASDVFVYEGGPDQPASYTAMRKIGKL